MAYEEAEQASTRAFRLSAVSGLLAFAVSLTSSLWVARLLNHAAGSNRYGLFVLLVQVYNISQTFDAGLLTLSLPSLASARVVSRDWPGLRRLWATSVLAALGVGWLLLASSWLVVSGTGALAFLPRPGLAVVCLLGALALPAVSLRSVCVALQRNYVFDLMEASINLTTLLLLSWAVSRGADLPALLACYLGPRIPYSCLLFVHLLRRAAPPLRGSGWRWDPEVWGLLRRQNGFFVVQRIGEIAMFYVPSLLVGSLAGPQEAGVYAFSSRLFNVPVMGLGYVYMARVGRMAQLHEQRRTRDLRGLLLGDLRNLALVTLPAAGALVGIVPLFTRWWAGPGLVGSPALVGALALWAGVSCLGTPVALLLLALGRSRVLGLTTLLNGVLNCTVGALALRWGGLPTFVAAQTAAVTLNISLQTWSTSRLLRAKGD